MLSVLNQSSNSYPRIHYVHELQKGAANRQFVKLLMVATSQNVNKYGLKSDLLLIHYYLFIIIN